MRTFSWRPGESIFFIKLRRRETVAIGKQLNFSRVTLTVASIFVSNLLHIIEEATFIVYEIS